MVNESKKLIDKVLSYIVTISYLSYVTIRNFGRVWIKEERYDNALRCVGKRGPYII